MMKIKGLMLWMLLFATTSLPAQYLHQAGDKAKDFEGVTVDGKPYHLYDSQAEYIIVCFWAADCDHCHDFLKSLRKNVDLKKDYELVTFALADNARQVKRKLCRMRIHGLHFFDAEGWDSQPFIDYDVVTTPTVILIDKDKNIIGEAFDWDEFKILIQENTKR